MENIPTTYQRPLEIITEKDVGKRVTDQDDQVKKACADFESIFLYYLLKTMRETVPRGGVFSAAGESAHTACFDLKIAEDLARKGGGIGLQDMIYHQLTNSHEGVKK